MIKKRYRFLSRYYPAYSRKYYYTESRRYLFGKIPIEPWMVVLGSMEDRHDRGWEKHKRIATEKSITVILGDENESN